MKRILNTLIFLLSVIAYSQETGSISGLLTDKETGNQPLPFANVTIKGTSKGTTTDFDGLFEISNITPGTYTVVFSFVGYETLEVPNIKVNANKTTTVNSGLGASAAALDEVVITTVARRDSETALLLNQKEAIDIKESIGSQELAKLGVSDVATATTKISGVTSSEASGEVYVRGLGDRYLYTTMNGLPIPSDDIEKKNIDLELFPTRVVSSIGISKTFSPQSSADQASGSVDITSRQLAGVQELSFSARAGVNTNVMQDGVSDNFKKTANSEDYSFGFYSKDTPTEDALTQQSWETQSMRMPINYRYTVTAGKKFGEKFKAFFTGSQRTDYAYRKGTFKEYQGNYIDDSFNDVEEFEKTTNTTGLIDLQYKINKNNNLRANSLFINKLTDKVYEQGRNGEGFVFEETNTSENLSQFVRDQNVKQTRLLVNQISGDHKIGEINELDWAAGYNIVNADEPNRIRNELNFNESTVQLARTGGYQQRKSTQTIDDKEFNALIKDKITFIKKEKDSSSIGFDVTIGGNYRNKKRDFSSQFFGLTENTLGSLTPSSIDNLDEVLNQDNIENGLLSENVQLEDIYNAELNSQAGFLSANFATGKFNINAGARYQNDEILVDYNVGNAPGGRIGNVSKNYDNIYPALNVKYELNEKNNFRIAASKTITLPEFKEIAPFEYISPSGQITRGNPDLEASNVYNMDVKWEFFPDKGELFSVTGFYKNISDPINKVRDRGSASRFSYYNVGDNATIYGLELDANFFIIKSSSNDKGADLDFGINVSRMWHEQDLKESRDENGTLLYTFQYDHKTEIGLQGASDWIFNANLNFTTKNKHPFLASLSANYASDKIFALGAPEIQSENDLYFNSEIIEKGFVVLNAVITKEIDDHFSVRFTGKNLLNPTIERVQDITPVGGSTTTEVVRSYTRGATLNLGISYKL